MNFFCKGLRFNLYLRKCLFFIHFDFKTSLLCSETGLCSVLVIVRKGEKGGEKRKTISHNIKKQV